jgi:hypothetical protein
MNIDMDQNLSTIENFNKKLIDEFILQDENTMLRVKDE